MKVLRYISITLLVLGLMISFVGVGLSGEKATKEECIEKVKAAVLMVKTDGLDATLEAVQDPNGSFVWKDSYVFCIDMDKQCNIAHPIKPTLRGKNLMGVKDSAGKFFFAEFINVAKEKGDGWISYMWPKVGEKKSSPKITYVHKVPGQNIFMASGIYK